MLASLFNKLRPALPQRGTWICAVRRGPTWIERGDLPPFRPFVLLVLEQERGRLRQYRLSNHHPRPPQLLALIRRAINAPMPSAGGKALPQRILLDDEDFWQTLKPALKGMGIHAMFQASVPQVKQVLRDMEFALAGRRSEPGLLHIPGVTHPLVAEYFDAAAGFHHLQAAPMYETPPPIEARYAVPGGATQSRYVLLQTPQHKHLGLTLFNARTDLDRFLNHDWRRPLRVPNVRLRFMPVQGMAFEDLDAMEHHGWSVAAANAHPVLLKSNSQGQPARMSLTDMLWLTALLRRLPDFLPAPAAEADFSLPNIHAGQAIQLRYVAELV